MKSGGREVAPIGMGCRRKWWNKSVDGEKWGKWPWAALNKKYAMHAKMSNQIEKTCIPS
jgi:hypothetical protein